MFLKSPNFQTSTNQIHVENHSSEHHKDTVHQWDNMLTIPAQHNLCQPIWSSSSTLLFWNYFSGRFSSLFSQRLQKMLMMRLIRYGGSNFIRWLKILGEYFTLDGDSIYLSDSAHLFLLHSQFSVLFVLLVVDLPTLSLDSSLILIILISNKETKIERHGDSDQSTVTRLFHSKRMISWTHFGGNYQWNSGETRNKNRKQQLRTSQNFKNFIIFMWDNNISIFKF